MHEVSASSLSRHLISADKSKALAGISHSDVCVVIPTYNEAANIRDLVSRVTSIIPSSVLVVDDNSPDGTGNIVRDLAEAIPNLKLISRPKKLGLGLAYAEGLMAALDQGYKYIIQMDCDFSHNPKYLVNFMTQIQNSDLVVGSKYTTGGRVEGLPLSRALLSRYGNMYIRTLLKLKNRGFTLRDTTSGYMCWRSDLLKKINLSRMHCLGYGFLIELKWIAINLGAKVSELPIVFRDRTGGRSKFSPSIAVEALSLPLRIHRLQKL